MKKLFSSLFLTLALGVLLGAFCDVVKAESAIPTSDIDFYIEKFNEITGNQYAPTYEDFDGFDYSFCLINESEDQICVYAIKYNNFVFKSVENINNYGWRTRQLGGSDNDDGLAFKNDTWIAGNTDCVKYFYYGYNNNLSTNYYVGTYRSIYGNWNESGYRFDCATITGNYNKYSYFPQSSSGSSDIYIGSNTTLYYSGYSTYTSYGALQGEITEDLSHVHKLVDVSFVEDDRLEIYTTYQANDAKLLNIDLSKFREIPNVPNLSFEYSDLNIVLNCDGVDVSFVLDDTNSNIVDILSNTNNVYTVITNYNLFGLDEYSDVFISSVSFSLITTLNGDSYTENYNIGCQYYLKQDHIPLEPEEIPDPEYNDTSVYTDQQITDMKSDLHEASSRFSFISGDWIFVSENDLPTFPGWATVFTNYVWFGDVNSDTTYKGHWFQMANNIPSIADLSRPFDPSAFIEENKTFAFYDVILLKVYTVGISVDLNLSTPAIQNYSLAGYLVLISDRYYDHYNAEINLDIVKQLQLSAENSVLFYEMLKTRLDDLAGDMDSGFNSLTDLNDGTQYKIIGWLKTLDTNIISSFDTLGSTLNSGFSSVVSAINNISIPSFGSSYSLPALSDELEYLFKPSLEWSAINYNDYVESLGVLALPFEFTFDVLDIAENQYDSDLKLHINQLSVDLPLEAGSDPETTSFTVLSEQDIDFEPTSVIPAALWSTLQYLNAFGLVLVQALGTYNHIFRGGDK